MFGWSMDGIGGGVSLCVVWDDDVVEDDVDQYGVAVVEDDVHDDDNGLQVGDASHCVVWDEPPVEGLTPWTRPPPHDLHLRMFLFFFHIFFSTARGVHCVTSLFIFSAFSFLTPLTPWRIISSSQFYHILHFSPPDLFNKPPCPFPCPKVSWSGQGELS